jgi:hypothetical protein
VLHSGAVATRPETRNLITALVGSPNLHSGAHTEHNLGRAPRGCVDGYDWNFCT